MEKEILPPFNDRVSLLFNDAINLAKEKRHEFLMPEHLLLALISVPEFENALKGFSDPEELKSRLEEVLADVETVPGSNDYEMEASYHLRTLFEFWADTIQESSAREIDITHIVNGLMLLQESWATHLLLESIHGAKGQFLSKLIGETIHGTEPQPEDMKDVDSEERPHQKKEEWMSLVTCMNECYAGRNPLIGREQELERTIQVLCRKDKNNPLHVGEPGVGKTALVWGLVGLIEEGKVPERLKGSRVYMMEMSTIIAGTQYRGEFEKRLKKVLDAVRKEGNNNIIYIDEIHTLVGAGATGDSAMDASNILKPYLEDGSIRFIGSTTYDELNRFFSRSKGLSRRFQQIDIDQPSVEETKNIVRQLLPRYEEFHGVRYSEEAVDFAVEASARHIQERFLPDKAIDLIDEAGAAMEVARRQREIGVKEIAEVLAKICKVDALAVADNDDFKKLRNLEKRISAKIFGQDEAVRQVVESVQIARAGLLEENKPLASLLFVGPTGVGKTEVSKVLAKELGVELIRFDMSEYVEKHSVAKLIGSPAGYVGYEDGGLLTDAVRKSPNCVLLLDEIEKAHQDIYNILLQVMDYASLTDNKGRKTDFRNVVLIMTSNAGAQFASQAGVGFASSVTRGSSMLKSVKKTFKPEFLNRLSGTVVFNDMDKEMATLILKKKIRELEEKLSAKNVRLVLSKSAFEHLLAEGYTPEYGAREMDRVILTLLNPILMREILFSSLKEGGTARVGLKQKELVLK